MDARNISLLLSVTIALISTAFLWILTEISPQVVIVAFFLDFGVAFLLFYLSLEFTILREINKVYVVIDKLKKKDFKISRKSISSYVPAIRNLNYQLYAYASQKQQEIEQLKKLEAYRREFLADVSHELKTPIFAAQGFIHTLIDGAMEDPEVRDIFLQKAARSLDSLTRLIEDLLTVSKMEAGIIKMDYTNFDMYWLTTQVIERLEEKARQKNITLSILRNENETYYVHADIQRIMQVMLNLVSNAIKYGIENGWVKISLQKKEDKVEVQVEDNGLGIPEEHLDRIFERFYRVEKSRSKDKGGSGLGLAIVKHILQAHQSEIKVASQVKKGTTFSFQLPQASSVPSTELQMQRLLQENEN
ncbi:MAG: ATP-binding protein [Cytophagales bacterium]|nr:ATP-binding protein [Cytophagales bacterium]